MTDLHTLLDRTVDQPVHLDPASAVDRGRRALRRRRRAVAAGAAAAVLVAGGAATAYTRPSALHLQPADQSDVTIRAGAFEIPAPPAGWAVQAADDHLVVVAPDDQPHVDLADPKLQLSAVGKLVLEYQRADFDPPKSGGPIQYDGRTFYAWTNPPSPDAPHQPDTVMASVREPTGGWLEVMAAPDMHWSQSQLVDYLDHVVVTSNAVPET
jgi:hypothetical protein